MTDPNEILNRILPEKRVLYPNRRNLIADDWDVGYNQAIDKVCERLLSTYGKEC